MRYLHVRNHVPWWWLGQAISNSCSCSYWSSLARIELAFPFELYIRFLSPKRQHSWWSRNSLLLRRLNSNRTPFSCWWSRSFFRLFTESAVFTCYLSSFFTTFYTMPCSGLDHSLLLARCSTHSLLCLLVALQLIAHACLIHLWQLYLSH